jgi:hypothetical protein
MQLTTEQKIIAVIPLAKRSMNGITGLINKWYGMG